MNQFIVERFKVLLFTQHHEANAYKCSNLLDQGKKTKPINPKALVRVSLKAKTLPTY